MSQDTSDVLCGVFVLKSYEDIYYIDQTLILLSSSGLWETQSTPETPTCRPTREELSARSQCHSSRGPRPGNRTSAHTYPHGA